MTEWLERKVVRVSCIISSPWVALLATLFTLGWWMSGQALDLLDNVVTFVGFPILFLLAAGQGRQSRDLTNMAAELVHAVPDADDAVAEAIIESGRTRP